MDRAALANAMQRAAERGVDKPFGFAEKLVKYGSHVPPFASTVDFAEPLKGPGTPTFMEAPLAPLAAGLEADVAVLGMPFEGATVRDTVSRYPRNAAPPPDPEDPFSRRGADRAPDAIRRGSLHYSLRASGGILPEYGLRLADHLAIVDVGDADVMDGTEEEAWWAGARAVQTITESGAVPLVIGGDHAVTGIVLDGIHLAKPDLRVGAVVFDTHYDLDLEPAHYAASFWLRAMESGILDPRNLVQIGLQGPANGLLMTVAPEELGVTTFTIFDVEREGMATIAKRAVEIAGDGVDALYVSLDVDSVDPAFCPAQKYPVPGGLTTREITVGLRTVIGDGPELCGFDLACLSPFYDVNHYGAAFAAHAFVDVMGTLATRRRRDA